MNNRYQDLAGDDVRPFLNEIAERLWSKPSHAAIMVGAGFSKNSNLAFPDWNKLGDLFYEKIHGCRINGSENVKYLNVLKLANEVEAAFGRPVLNKLLKEAIPENSSAPSELHKKLLSLPWTDIFTTNYDTLLEKASNSIVERKYDIVLNKEDLVYSEQPRIIKLHGSFPSESPFIITEEDYRTYPSKFAPFVNTVQQSLIENTFCLVGFSGDDPNFLQWIGWIRDNLGKEGSSKIYLVGLFNITEAQKFLLEQRNIVLVDLSSCKGVKVGDHSSALKFFFSYLESYKNFNFQTDWPNESFKRPPFNEKELDKALKDIIVEWRKIRLEYPGWIVAPDRARSKVWAYTENWLGINTLMQNADLTLKTNYLYELNWRIQIALFPIPNDIAQTYIETITLLREDTKRESIFICLELELAILRWYREEGFFIEWEELYSKIKKEYKDLLSSEQWNYLSYEYGLFLMFRLEFIKLYNFLTKWHSEDSHPIWSCRKASLLLEINKVEEANVLINKSLFKVREKLNLSPIEEDYNLVSTEAIIMMLSHYIIDSKKFFPQKSETDSEEETDKRVREYNERWNVLKGYRCDPIGDNKLFRSKLEKEPVIRTRVNRNPLFDVGSYQISHRNVRWDTEAVDAYKFLRYTEVTGFIFRTERVDYFIKPAAGAIDRIGNYSSYWALVTCIRLRDRQYVNNIFNRKSLIRYEVAEIDNFITFLLGTLKQSLTLIEENNNIYEPITKTLPEILSRLCSRSSEKVKEDLLFFVLGLYSFPYKKHFSGIKVLLKRIFACLSIKVLAKHFNKIISVPFPENVDVESEFINPVQFVSSTELKGYKESIQIDKNTIQNLFSVASSFDNKRRKWGCEILAKLYDVQLLSTSQINRFGKILWKKIESDFPSDTDFYKFSFLFLPHPKDIHVDYLYKEYLKKLEIPEKINANSYSFGTGNHIFSELRNGHRIKLWQFVEVENIFNRLIKWWDLGKNHLNKSVLFDGDIVEEMNNLKKVLIEFIFPYFISQSNIPKDVYANIEKIVSEFNEFGLFNLELRISILSLSDIEEYNLINEIKIALRSNNEKGVLDALWATNRFLQLFKEKNYDNCLLLLDEIGKYIEWRKNVELDQVLNLARLAILETNLLIESGFIGSCLLGLEYLIEESELRSEINSGELAKKLEVRVACVKLAAVLSELFKRKKKKIPEVLSSWESITKLDTEFAEVKVAWHSQVSTT